VTRDALSRKEATFFQSFPWGLHQAEEPLTVAHLPASSADVVKDSAQFEEAMKEVR